MRSLDRWRARLTQCLFALLAGLTILAACSSDSEVDSPSQGPSQIEPAANGSSGCEQLPLDVVEFETDRDYLLTSPPNMDNGTPRPLMFNLHGHGATAAITNEVSRLDEAGAQRGYVVVAPSARDGVWEYGPTGEDAEFLSNLYDHITSSHCIDLDRVHFVGMSLGSWKSAVTACATLSGKVASIALVTVEVFPNECNPMPVIAFHGTADTVVAYGDGGGTIDAANTPNAGLPGTLANMEAWAESSGCAPTATTTAIADDIVHHYYPNCMNDISVELYTILDGHHVWPGAEPDLYGGIPVTQSIDATELILDFFDQHPHS